MAVIKKITIPAKHRKKTTLASNLYYDTIEIHENSVIGFLNGQQTMVWYFKDYNGIDFVKAGLNSQFAQIIFLTGINSQNRVVGIDFTAKQNMSAMNDTNRILLCSGMFSFGKTNEYADSIASDIRNAFENYRANSEGQESMQPLSEADELQKFKRLLDDGTITQDEFDAKKKQILGI